MKPIDSVRKTQAAYPFGGFMARKDIKYLSIIENVEKYAPKGGRILDFGSGGCDVPVLLQSRGYLCTAYDDWADHWHLAGNNREILHKYAQSHGVEIVTADRGLGSFQKESFDMVMMHDVLEHLHDSPRPLLNGLLELIKAGGTLYATVPNSVNIKKRVNVALGRTNLPPYDYYYWSGGPWRGHVREYAMGDLKSMAGYLDLEILLLAGEHHMLERRLSPFTGTLFRMASALFPAWRDTLTLIGRKPSSWKRQDSISWEESKRLLNEYSAYQYE